MRRLAPLLIVLAAFLALPAAADEASPDRRIRLPESLSVSPDGSTIVLSWRGDLWRAPSAGGAARRLTLHPAPDTRPHVSPDGAQIAFVSTRSGAEQVYVMPFEGGTPRQVTLHTEGARVYDWFPDGGSLLIRSARDHDWQRAERLFRKPLDLEAAPELLFDAECGHGKISPDGGLVAFTRGRGDWTRKGYRGTMGPQLWLYDVHAKTYRRLSEGDYGEMWPLWGKDAGTLYYVSESDGTWNLWSLDLAANTRTQITHHKDDGVTWPAISADGSTVVYRRLFEIHRLDLRAGAQPVLVDVVDTGDPTLETLRRDVVTRATAAAFTDDAREIAIVAGGDVWVMDTELREPKQVTNTPAEERDPIFSRDFETLWFVSDAAGESDIWKVHRTEPDAYWWQNDTFRAERVTEDAAVESDLQLTPDGKRLAYLRGGDLWSMAIDGSDPKLHVRSFSGVQWSFSPDGRWIAYAKPDDDFNWDVWIAPVDASTPPVNVSVHPDNDRDPVWSPDGKLLAFTGQRWSEESDICYVWLNREDGERDARDRTLEKALEKMKKRAAKAGKKPPTPAGTAPEAAPQDPVLGAWSGRLSGTPPVPEGGLALKLEIAREGAAYTGVLEVVGQFSGTTEAFTFDPKTGALTFALTTPLGALSGSGRVGDGRMEGTWKIEGVMEGAFELTRTAQAPANPADGAAPEKPAAASTAPEPLTVDLEGIADRVQRISIPEATESGLFWSHDGKTLAFRATIKGEAALWTVTFPDQLAPKRLATASGGGARWLKEGNQIAWLSGGKPAVLSASGKATSFAFQIRQEVDVAALHGAVFDQAWRVMRDSFYDERMNNLDWNAIRAKYGPMAAACLTSAELSLVVNMMLGELNASHMGFRTSDSTWSAAGWKDVTGHLGCRFDPSWAGPGLKVRDVVTGTPAAEARSRIAPGEVVLAIDGRPVGPATNLTRLMTGDPRRTVEIQVLGAEGEERTVSLRPTTYGAVRGALYDDALAATRRMIDERSGGTLGYLHIRSMNWSSFQRFEAELYKVGHGKDGLIIDVRDNGGGFTTDHLLTCLTQPRHAITVPRGGGPGYPNDRMVYAAWHKPVIVLCNQNSFSNAEIFAQAIKTLGRGPVVGVQTAGGVISTGGTAVMGQGFLRLPFRGWFRLGDGNDMERNGCVPDHLVWPDPADHALGRDRQVEKAIEVGLAEVARWKARPQVTLRKASER